MGPSTIPEMFLQAVGRRPKPDRILQKRDKEYVPLSSEEYRRRVFRCARALESAGIGPGDRVGIVSYNRVEWAVVDYAALMLGAVTVPTYTTLPADKTAYILRDAGVKICFAENARQYEKIRSARADLPDLSRIVTLTPADGAESLDDFLSSAEGEVEPRPKPEDLATLIYTSGTTGTPKGVMLTHANLVSNLLACCEALEFGPGDLGLSFLPLSHSFQRTVDYALFHGGASIAYCESVDRVVTNLQEVRPTVMAAVPRFFETVRARIEQALAKTTGLKARLAKRAIAVGEKAAPYRMQGRRLPPVLALRYALARALVLNKMQERTGGRLRMFVSGGAPLSAEVARFLWSLGFTLLEGYGLTETSPVISCNRFGRTRIGTVGLALPGVEVRTADDGEILIRGPNVMKGYYKMAEATAEMIRDGWLHTGDVGEIEDGFIRITDRKKDLIKTSGGRYIAPQPIENRFKESPLVANAVLIGDQRPFSTVLLVPDYDLLRERFGEGESNEKLAANPDVLEFFRKELDRVNKALAAHERPKKFALLHADFTIESGELTPTMKVKRRVVQERHAQVIDDLYR